jgi:hypothetical protein
MLKATPDEQISNLREIRCYIRDNTPWRTLDLVDVLADTTPRPVITIVLLAGMALAASPAPTDARTSSCPIDQCQEFVSVASDAGGLSPAQSEDGRQQSLPLRVTAQGV